MRSCASDSPPLRPPATPLRRRNRVLRHAVSLDLARAVATAFGATDTGRSMPRWGMTIGMRRNVLRPDRLPSRRPRHLRRAVLRPRLRLRADAAVGLSVREPDTARRARGRDHDLRTVVGVGLDDLGDELARPVKLPVRGAVVALAFVSFVMSVAIAEAFADRAWTFAIAFVVLQVGRTGFIVWATARHDRAVSRDFLCILVWTVAGAVLWITGAVLPLSSSSRSGPPPSASSSSARYSAIRCPESGGCGSRRGTCRVRTSPSGPRCSC